MAFLKTLSISPFIWCIWMTLGVIATILSGAVVRSEHKKRQIESTIIASPFPKITSAVAIGCGPLVGTSICLSVVPGCCMTQFTLLPMMLGLQFASLSMYQLSRLHYCFSKTSSHHQNGYPLWLFAVMVTVGFVYSMSGAILLTLGQPLPARCGFASDFSFEWEYRDSSILFEGTLAEQKDLFYRYYSLNAVLGGIWDITTFLLYGCKIKTFGKISALRRDTVWRKIMFILQRVVITNLLYWISGLIINAPASALISKIPETVFRYTIINVLCLCSGVMYSVSTYLMMEHNIDEYVQFLRYFKRFYVKYICFCCCHRIVDRQLMEFEAMELEKQSEETRNPRLSSTEFPNNSKYVSYSIEGKEMSLQTVTKVADCD